MSSFLRLGALIVGLSAVPAMGATIYTLASTGRLISQDSNALAGPVLSSVFVSGLASGDRFAAIDFNPANGKLYGVTEGSRLYQLDTATGVATQVGPDGGFVMTTNGLGMDFDPITGQLYLASADDDSMVVNPLTGLMVSSLAKLTFAGGDTHAGALNVAGAAFTSGGALYGIEGVYDALVVINRATGEVTTVGGLGVEQAGTLGFDIDAAGSAFVANSYDNTLYSVNLGTGAATKLGVLGVGSAGVVGIAAAPDAAGAPTGVPEPGTVALISGGLLVLVLRRR